MNIVLFTAEEVARPLPLSDPRAQHILTVLKRLPGESFDAGVINGPRGRGVLSKVGTDALTFTFSGTESPAPPERVTLVVGLPRPQTARDILRDATSLGVAAMHFVITEKGERNYAQSSLWTTGEWRRHLVTGAAQAFETHIPEIAYGQSLAETLDALTADSKRLALDHYESTGPLGNIQLTAETQVVLALGPERGWSAGDRTVLRSHDFQLVHLGRRVLRCEIAVVAALTLVQAARGRS